MFSQAEEPVVEKGVFAYAAFEANEKRKFLSNAWESGEATDRARRDAEKEAFNSLVSAFVESWREVVERSRAGA